MSEDESLHFKEIFLIHKQNSKVLTAILARAAHDPVSVENYEQQSKNVASDEENRYKVWPNIFEAGIDVVVWCRTVVT